MCYSSSCVIYTIKRERRSCKKLFENWITIFGDPAKILVDNGCEFCNKEFVSTFCENLNIRICTSTTVAESLWSNGLVECHNAVLGLTVSKTMEDAHCDLNIALAWAVSAKNALKNVHGFSPDQLVFSRNPNFPNVFDSQLSALEGQTTSEIVANNLNAMHAAQQQSIKSECSEKIARALRHQTRTYSNNPILLVI